MFRPCFRQSSLLPLNGTRRLRRDIVRHPVDALDFVDDAVRHASEQLIGQPRPVRRHAIGAVDIAYNGHVLIGAAITHNTDGAHRQQDGETLPDLIVELRALQLVVDNSVGCAQDWRQVNRAVFPDGSHGNGAAMRAPVIGLYYANRLDELDAAARKSAEITHAHPLAIEGALLVATATRAALAGVVGADLLDAAAAACGHAEFRSRLLAARSWLSDTNPPEPREVAGTLGNGMCATESCVTAVYIGARHLDLSFEELLQFAIGCKGDVDTISAMAGAIWGAANGADALPKSPLLNLEQADLIRRVALALHERTFQG